MPASEPDPINAPDPRTPAHRPSRRHLIVEASVRVFARKGFADASIQDIADEAGMVPTAVYYHFAGKNELFEVALTHAINEIDAVVEGARVTAGEVTGETLSVVITAVWEWIEAHPDEARIVYVHLPGATSNAQVLSRQFEERHAIRAYDYLDDRGVVRGDAERAAAVLLVRTLMTMLMAIHPLRLEEGPLSKRTSKGLRAGLDAVSRRLTGGAQAEARSA